MAKVRYTMIVEEDVPEEIFEKVREATNSLDEVARWRIHAKDHLRGVFDESINFHTMKVDFVE